MVVDFFSMTRSLGCCFPLSFDIRGLLELEKNIMYTNIMGVESKKK